MAGQRPGRGRAARDIRTLGAGVGSGPGVARDGRRSAAGGRRCSAVPRRPDRQGEARLGGDRRQTLGMVAGLVMQARAQREGAGRRAGRHRDLRLDHHVAVVDRERHVGESEALLLGRRILDRRRHPAGGQLNLELRRDEIYEGRRVAVDVPAGFDGDQRRQPRGGARDIAWTISLQRQLGLFGTRDSGARRGCHAGEHAGDQGGAQTGE